MAFPISAGVYGREIEGDVTSSPQIGFTGAALISALKGPTEPTLITSERQFYKIYGKPTMDRPSMHVAARFLRQGNAATIRRVIVDATAATGEVAGSVDPYLVITAANEGTWGNSISVTFNQDPDDTDIWELIVKENAVEVEKYTVSFIENDVDGYGQPRFIEERVKNSRYIRAAVDPVEVLSVTDALTVSLTGGTDDTTPVGDAELVAAIEDFRNVDNVDVNYFFNAGWISAAVQSAMVDVMEYRQDGIVILDMPNTTVASELVTFRKTESNINSSFAAYYAGWLRILETTTGKEVYIPPSGDIAAIYSASQQGTIWDAPAGLRRGVVNGILGVNKIWSENERDVLYPAGINPIQSFAGEGVVVWGQKTAYAIASSLDRINVRFLLNYVRGTAVASLKPFVFQANSEFTRNSIFSLLDNFMSGVQANDGVYGYRIEIGTDVNNSEVIENNQLLVNILVQPTRTAEFIRVDTITVPLAQDL